MYTGEENYKRVISDLLHCTNCSLASLRTNVVIYRGNPRSDVMIVGEGPGEKEDLEGKPMVGPTGSYLVSLLEKNGFDLTKIYITNIILCREPGNGDPTPEHIRSCYPNLMRQIELVNPKYIIAVGRHAMKVLIPSIDKLTITQVAGTVYTPPHLNSIVIPIQHPSYIMRARSLTEQYEKLIKKVCDQIKEDRAF